MISLPNPFFPILIFWITGILLFRSLLACSSLFGNSPTLSQFHFQRFSPLKKPSISLTSCYHWGNHLPFLCYSSSRVNKLFAGRMTRFLGELVRTWADWHCSVSASFWNFLPMRWYSLICSLVSNKLKWFPEKLSVGPMVSY